MKIFSIFFFALIVSALASVRVSADELVELNRSVRALGMGDAYTSIATGHDALFYNPAGLADNHGLSWEIIDIHADADGTQVYQTFQNLNNSGSYVTALHNFFGEDIYVGLAGKTSLTIGNFAFSYYDTGYVSASLTNPALPTLNTNIINDTGMAIGAGFELYPGIKWGVTGRRVTRFGSNLPIGIDSLILLNNTQLQMELSNQGTGYALDSGFQFTLPGSAKPTFSFVWKDIGVTSFTPLTTVGPPQQADEMVAGFGMQMKGPLFTLSPTFEIQQLNNYNEELGKKLHAGIELSLPLVDLRAGIYQGYYTLGAGVDLGFFRVDAATYEVERGIYPGQDGDRRYIVEASLVLSFDPDFSFLSVSGKKAIIERR